MHCVHEKERCRTAAAASSAETSAQASAASRAALSAASSCLSCCCSDSTLAKLRPPGAASVRGVSAPLMSWTFHDVALISWMCSANDI